MTRWVLKPAALARAAKRLGLKHPVTVKPYKSFWAGEYDCRPLHVIWVNKKISPSYNPAWTIWHELGHALQCERDFGGDGDCFDEVMDRVYTPFMTEDRPIIPDTCTYHEWLAEYLAIPFEQEAEEIAKKYSERYPLVRIVKDYKALTM